MMLEIGPNLLCLLMVGVVFAFWGLIVWRL